MTANNSELLHLAKKANQIALRVNPESQVDRLKGRLARDPRDVDAICQCIVYGAKEGGAFSGCSATDESLLILHRAIVHVSYLCWEDLWNEAHPDQFGEAWPGDDLELMSKWREKVHLIITDCQQEWLLTLSAGEYLERLLEAGAEREEAEELAEWLSIVRQA